MYYIGTNEVGTSGYTEVMIKYNDGWWVDGYDGEYWHERVKASEVLERKDLLTFDTYEEAEAWLIAEGGKFGDEVIEVKETKDMDKKFYGIKFVTDMGNEYLVSVVDIEYPMHTSNNVAVVSSKPEELVHLVKILPENYHGKIVAVTMNEDGKWEIGKEWKSEPVEQRYVYMLKGMSEASYIYVADNGVVSLTESPLKATLMTHEEAMDLASKRGLKLTAFEEIEIEEVD